MAGPRELLRRPLFRGLYAARLTSQFADGVFEASLFGFVVFSPDKAPDALHIAGSLAAVLLPFTLVGPFAGIALDRMSRQKVLVASGYARAVVLVGLASLMAAGHRGPDLIAVAIVVLSLSRFVLSALSAALPVVVSDTRDLVPANSLSTTSGTIATTAGAGLGAGVRGILGTSDSNLATVALVAAGCYVLASLVARRIAGDALGPLTPQPWRTLAAELGEAVAEVVDGARVLWGHRAARLSLAALSVHRMCYGVSFVATVLLYRSYFADSRSGGDIVGLGSVVAASGLGTVLAAIVTPRVTRGMSRQRWISLVLVAAGAVQVAFGIEYDARLFLVAALVLGFVAQAAKICVDSLIQESIPDSYRGRAFSFYDQSVNLCYVAAAAVAATVLPPNGKSYAVLLAIAALYVAAGVVYSAVSRADGTGSAGAVPEAEQAAVGR